MPHRTRAFTHAALLATALLSTGQAAAQSAEHHRQWNPLHPGHLETMRQHGLDCNLRYDRCAPQQSGQAPRQYYPTTYTVGYGQTAYGFGTLVLGFDSQADASERRVGRQSGSGAVFWQDANTPGAATEAALQRCRKDHTGCQVIARVTNSCIAVAKGTLVRSGQGMLHTRFYVSTVDDAFFQTQSNRLLSSIERFAGHDFLASSIREYEQKLRAHVKANANTVCQADNRGPDHSCHSATEYCAIDKPKGITVTR